MPEDTYYPEPDDQQTTIAEAAGAEDKEATDYSTGLLPKELFGEDIKPGDTVTVKIKRVLDDEVEVAMSGNENKGDEEPSDADREIDAMANIESE